jgi:hypothetical protein
VPAFAVKATVLETEWASDPRRNAQEELREAGASHLILALNENGRWVTLEYTIEADGQLEAEKKTHSMLANSSETPMWYR